MCPPLFILEQGRIQRAIGGGFKNSLLLDDMQDGWIRIFYDLKLLKNCTIPRYLWSFDQTKNCTYELHIFADASRQAFCCVACIVKRASTNVESSLIFSKLKLTPKRHGRMKEISIPRLELLGVFLATTVKIFCVQQLQDFGFMVDSITVWSYYITVAKFTYNTMQFCPKQIC